MRISQKYMNEERSPRKFCCLDYNQIASFCESPSNTPNERKGIMRNSTYLVERFNDAMNFSLERIHVEQSTEISLKESVAKEMNQPDESKRYEVDGWEGSRIFAA